MEIASSETQPSVGDGLAEGRRAPVFARRVREVFEALVDLPASQHGPGLDQLCGDDMLLRSQVAALLRRDLAGDEELSNPALEVAEGPRCDSDSRRWIGERLGPYRILRTLATGGMGQVFLAERSDDEFHLPVAVKVLRQGFEDAALQRRFRTERQILASLDHPNICRLLDGGTTADGTPYLVMEYLVGVPVLAYCDQHRLSVRERLRLFRSICSPVAHAHGHLVVHRDLKPSNILITEQGEPKLLDFGIAKLLEPAAFFAEPEATSTLDRFLTPRYASPEQAAGRPVTVASDIYALGVVLYELLCGQQPNSHGGGELLPFGAKDWRLPDPPSVRARQALAGSDTGQDRDELAALRGSTARALARSLAGDLDRIVLKALQPRPADRYESVEAFAEDLRRHQAGLPVLARPASLRYRTAKFLHRNALPVAVSTLLIAGLFGFGVANALKSEHLARQVEESERQRLRAEQVTQFLVETFTLTDPTETSGQTLTAADILRRGTERVATELKDQPEVRATLQQTLGEIQLSFGSYREAETLLEQAVDGRQALLPPDHPDLLESLDALAFLKTELEEFDQAREIAERVLEARRRQVGEGPATEELAASLSTLGWLYGKQGNPAAIPLLEEALAIVERLKGPEDLASATNRNNLASGLANLGRSEEAVAQYRELVTRFRRILPPGDASLLRYLDNWAITLMNLERFSEAEAIYREALPQAREVYGETQATASLVHGLGMSLFRQGEAAAAEPYLREALALHEKTNGEDDSEATASRIDLAKLLTEQGRCQEALPLARSALRARKEHLGPGHWKTALAGGVLAGCLAQTGRPAEAERLLVEGYAVLRDRGAAAAWSRRDHLRRMISFFESQGRLAEVDHYRELLRLEQGAPK